MREREASVLWEGFCRGRVKNQNIRSMMAYCVGGSMVDLKKR